MTVEKKESAHTWQPRAPETDRDTTAQTGRLMSEQDTGNTNSEILGTLNLMNGGTLGEKMGIEFVEVTSERVVARMPVAGNTQPFGLLHGGASVVLAETLGSIGAMMHAGQGRIAVGIEINATHHRAARSGFVTGTATALSLGNTLATYEILITDEDGKLVCTSRITCLIRASAPGRTTTAPPDVSESL
jgi:1,4-dihydroxy-2-naphthoyl-CoA hydrolase